VEDAPLVVAAPVVLGKQKASGADHTLPTEAVLRAALHVGAPNPDHFNGNGNGNGNINSVAGGETGGGGGSGGGGGGGSSSAEKYTLCQTDQCTSQPGVQVYTRAGKIDTDTIFAMASAEENRRPSARKPSKFLYNRVSTVHVGHTKEFVSVKPESIRIKSR
jgi:hypothetical protein